MTMYDDHINSCKRHRMDIMDEYLASIGQQRKPIAKDGSCLFRAVSEQLFSNQAQHLHVRESCVSYMERHREVFENFIDDPFDEYLIRMSNPKEWGDQMEICAISKMYRCDFYIYEQPGQMAKNVTENGFHRKIYLCHSGQKHYDGVFSIEYFKTYGICQSIVASILFQTVLGMSTETEDKLVQSYRMLSSSDVDCKKTKENKNREIEFSLPSVYEPSIGTLSEGVRLEDQIGLAYRFPVSLAFIRSLDPSVCRNIDYDFWITIKRKQQYIDFSVAEGLQYCIGDRCLVTLNIYSKPLVGHVQEVSPDNGPITVFIEALGEMHTIAVKNARSLDSFNNRSYVADGCRGEHWASRFRRSPSESSWIGRNGEGRKYYGKSKHGTYGYGKKFGEELEFSPKHHLNFVTSQKKLKGGSSGKITTSGTGGKSDRSKVKPWNGHSPCRTLASKKFLGNEGQKYCRWKNTRLPSMSSEFSPTSMFRRLEINQDTFTEDPWNSSSGECSESTVVIPPYPGNYSEWENESNFHINPNCPPPPARYHSEDTFSHGQQYWGHEKQIKSVSSHHEQQDYRGPSNDNYASQTVEAHCGGESNGAPHALQEPQSSASSPPEEEYDDANRSLPLQEYQHDPGLHNPCPQDQPHPSDPYVSPHVTTPSVTPASTFVATPSNAIPIPPAGGYMPYSATMTVYDCESKEASDKIPFQYFYNLGLEWCNPPQSPQSMCVGMIGIIRSSLSYYRQLSAGAPRAFPVVVGGSPTPFGTVLQQPQLMHPQPMNFLPPTGPAHYPSPLQPGSNCPPVPHYHPAVVSPPSGAMHAQFPPGRFMVHVPPAPQHQYGPQARPTLPDGVDVVPMTVVADHALENDDTSLMTTTSSPVIHGGQLLSTHVAPVQGYPGTVPNFQGEQYLPQYYPQAGPAGYPPSVRMYEINEAPVHSANQVQSRSQYTT